MKTFIGASYTEPPGKVLVYFPVATATYIMTGSSVTGIANQRESAKKRSEPDAQSKESLPRKNERNRGTGSIKAERAARNRAVALEHQREKSKRNREIEKKNAKRLSSQAALCPADKTESVRTSLNFRTFARGLHGRKATVPQP